MSDIVDKLAVLSFHICEMNELLLAHYCSNFDLLRSQSAIVQSLQDLRDTLQEEPKKD